MSMQRKRGRKLQYWKAVATTNFYGDKVERALDGPYEARYWESHDRSSRAEVPGQQEVDVIKVGIDATHDVSLWARVKIGNIYWDIESPPAYRHGTRGTRHQTVSLRQRTVKDG